MVRFSSSLERINYNACQIRRKIKQVGDCDKHTWGIFFPYGANSDLIKLCLKCNLVMTKQEHLIAREKRIKKLKKQAKLINHIDLFGY